MIGTVLHRVRPGFLAAMMLAMFWWLAVSASTHWSQTSDELPHVTAGYAYDRFGDYRMHPENGNLPQRVHGLAPLLLDARFPMDEARWSQSDYWQLGWDFLYGVNNPTDRILFGARTLNALFGVALGAFVFVLARRWHGDTGGLLALGFFALCPNFLAHSALATSDLAGTLMLTLAPWFFWRHLEHRDWRSGIWAGLASGFALVSKFNGVLLFPIYALLIGADARFRSDNNRWSRLGQNLLLAGAQAAAGAMLIWAFFGFRFSPVAPGLPPLLTYDWPWPPLADQTGWLYGFLAGLRRWQILPEAYVMGFSHVVAGEAVRPAFFAGEYKTGGWVSFFPTLFLVKTPLATLAALCLVAIRATARRPSTFAVIPKRWLDSVPLVVTAVVAGTAVVTSALNLGHRHLLPIYPILFISLGALAEFTKGWRRLVPVSLLLFLGVESIGIRPHYPAFFNIIIGGPANAYRLVVESSLDWGQALPDLQAWLEKERRTGEPLYLSYFGNAWPPHYGVRPTRFLPAINLVRPPFEPYEFEPGLYCVSATSLMEVYSEYRGSWRDGWEARLHDPAASPYEREGLRFSRLCKYLQYRPPDAHAGHAILIYRLTMDEITEALTGPVKGW